MNVIRAFEAFVDDLSNWYIRRSRRLFWEEDEVAFRTLWYALVQSLRVIGPVMPFLADHLWWNLARGREASVHLAGWPEVADPDVGCSPRSPRFARVVELGRQARSTSGLKLRQPLRVLMVAGAPLADGHADEIADELRIKEVEFGEVGALLELRVKPNLPAARAEARQGSPEVRAALAEGRSPSSRAGRFQVTGFDLSEDEVLIDRGPVRGAWVHATDG